MKRKTLALLLGLVMVFGLVACSSTPAENDQPPMTAEEIQKMHADPDSYKGRELTIYGKLLGTPEKDNDGIYFQMYCDPVNYAQSVVVGYGDPSLALPADCYVKVTGTVDGKFEAENMLGGTVTGARIIATSVEESNYVDAVAPTLKSTEVNQTQEQFGYSVTIQKVEFAGKETRIYLCVTNNGSDKFSLYSFNAKILQNGTQYSEAMNYDAGYPEIEDELLVGATTEGVICFPALEQATFQLSLEAYSNNWQETIEPFVFDITVE